MGDPAEHAARVGDAFVAGGGLIRQMNFEYSILVYALVWRNFIVFAHNLLVWTS